MLKKKPYNPPKMTITTESKDFRQILSQVLTEAEQTERQTGDFRLRFSKHASIRLNSREIDLSPEQLRRVEEGVSRAGLKGVMDSLVLVDGLALVVNTKSRTVITAMEHSQHTNGGVFTNIDGAVIV